MTKQFITDEKGNRTHILISMSAYEQLVEDAEMLNDVAAFKKALAEVDESIPHEMVKRLSDGENPVTVWREHRGMKIKQLAEQSGITPSYLSMIEAGKREPSVKSLKQIADALGVEMDDLIFYR